MHTSSFLVRGHSRSCFSIAPGAVDSRPWLAIRGGWISTTRHVVVPRIHRPRSFLPFFLHLDVFFFLPSMLRIQPKAWQRVVQMWVCLGRLETRTVWKRPNDDVRHERWTSTSDGPCFPIRMFPIDDCRTNHHVCDMPHDPKHPCLGMASSDARTRISHHDVRRTCRSKTTTTIANRNPCRRSTTSTHVRGDAAIEQESSLALARRETKRRTKDAVENTTTTDESYVRRRPTTRACRTPRGSSWLHRRRKKHGRSHAHACGRPRGWK